MLQRAAPAARTSCLRRACRQPASLWCQQARAASDAHDTYNDEHLLLTEQEQGTIMEKLQDPEEVRRLLHTVRHRGTLGETMADRIVREALEAQVADLNRKMRDATSKRELCEHGHQHDVCCGASKGEVEPEA